MPPKSPPGDKILSVKEKTYSVVLESIEKQLRRGELQIGDRLPSERALSERFGISRASVREALQVLTTVGLVRSSVGSGPASGAVVISEPSSALSWALRLHIATRALPVADVVNTRLLLEAQAAQDAAQAQDHDQRKLALGRAREYLLEMDSPTITDERFHFCDTRFHLEISRLGNNIALETVIDALHLATLSYVEEAVPHLDSWPETKKTLQDQHRKILEAVEGREPEQAHQAVSDHILWFYHKTNI